VAEKPGARSLRALPRRRRRDGPGLGLTRELSPTNRGFMVNQEPHVQSLLTVGHSGIWGPLLGCERSFGQVILALASLRFCVGKVGTLPQKVTLRIKSCGSQ